MGQSINVSFLRPITEGSIEVHARARHRGRTTWVWEAEVRDAEERVCALAADDDRRPAAAESGDASRRSGS